MEKSTECKHNGKINPWCEKLRNSQRINVQDVSKYVLPKQEDKPSIVEDESSLEIYEHKLSM